MIKFRISKIMRDRTQMTYLDELIVDFDSSVAVGDGIVELFESDVNSSPYYASF